MALVLQDDVGHLVLGRRDRHVAELVARTAEFALDVGQAVVCVGSWDRGRDRRALLDLARRHPGTSALVRTSDAHRWPEAARAMRHDISTTASAETVVQIVLGALEASRGR